jgi:hypothetical protein
LARSCPDLVWSVASGPDTAQSGSHLSMRTRTLSDGHVGEPAAVRQRPRAQNEVGARARDVAPRECAGQPVLPELLVDVVELRMCTSVWVGAWVGGKERGHGKGRVQGTRSASRSIQRCAPSHATPHVYGHIVRDDVLGRSTYPTNPRDKPWSRLNWLKAWHSRGVLNDQVPGRVSKLRPTTPPPYRPTSALVTTPHAPGRRRG